MAFPDYGLLDVFAGDGALSSFWVSPVAGHNNGWPLVRASNMLRTESGRSEGAAQWRGIALIPDIQAYFMLTAFTDGNVRLYTRYDPVTKNGYGLRLATGGPTLVRVDAGVETTLDMVVTPVAGFGVGIEIVGDRLRAFIDSGSGYSQVLEAFDGTYAATGHCVITISFAAGSPTYLDDFGGGPLPFAVSPAAAAFALTSAEPTLARAVVPSATTIRLATVAPVAEVLIPRPLTACPRRFTWNARRR